MRSPSITRFLITEGKDKGIYSQSDGSALDCQPTVKPTVKVIICQMVSLLSFLPQSAISCTFLRIAS